MNHSIIKEKAFIIIIVLISMIFIACTGNKSQSDASPVKAASSTQNKADTTNQQKLIDAPDFTLSTMNGESFTLSEHEGEVVVLNVWATWCPPCRKEIPDFIEIQKEMQDQGVLFVGVSVDEEGWEVVKPFAKKYGINYPLVVDDGTIYQKYGPFIGIPTTFVINKKGKVEYAAPGMINRAALQPALEELVSR